MASLEYFVNLDPQDGAPDLVSIRVEIPGAILIETVEPATLPANWRRNPYPRELLFTGISAPCTSWSLSSSSSIPACGSSLAAVRWEIGEEQAPAASD
jgi:hypothetical protein